MHDLENPTVDAGHWPGFPSDDNIAETVSICRASRECHTAESTARLLERCAGIIEALAAQRRPAVSQTNPGPHQPNPRADRWALTAELAWGLIANAGGGFWDRESADWKLAAERWRDRHYRANLTLDRAEAEDFNDRAAGGLPSPESQNTDPSYGDAERYSDLVKQLREAVREERWADGRPVRDDPPDAIVHFLIQSRGRVSDLTGANQRANAIIGQQADEMAGLQIGLEARVSALEKACKRL